MANRDISSIYFDVKDLVEAEFEIRIAEDEAVEMYDMNLQEASEYIQKLITAQ